MLEDKRFTGLLKENFPVYNVKVIKGMNDDHRELIARNDVSQMRIYMHVFIDKVDDRYLSLFYCWKDRSLVNPDLCMTFNATTTPDYLLRNYITIIRESGDILHIESSIVEKYETSIYDMIR